MRTFWLYSLLGLAGVLLLTQLPSSTDAAATVSWSVATVESDTVASSTRMVYDAAGGNFALAYMHSARNRVIFATSTAGAVWATAIATSTDELFDGELMFGKTQYSSGTSTYMLYGPKTGVTQAVVHSTNGGNYWTTTLSTGIDVFLNGQLQFDTTGRIYIVGRVQNESVNHLRQAKNPAGVAIADSFTTSSINSGFVAGPTADLIVSGSSLAAAYAAPAANALYVVTSTDAGVTWNATSTVASSIPRIVHPRIKMDSTGKMWVAYIAGGASDCASRCVVAVSRYESASGWVTEYVDLAAATITSGYHEYLTVDIGFVNGNKPVVMYYDATNDRMRYAYRDSGAAFGCNVGGITGWAGAGAGQSSNWSCGTVASGIGGYPEIAVATDANQKVVGMYQTYGTTAIKAAYATISDASTGGLLAQLEHILNPKIVINDGAKTTQKREVELGLSGTNISEMALSLNEDFIHSAWEPFVPKKKITLANKTGKQRVYVKYGNNSGAVSDVLWAEIAYEPAPVVVEQPAPAPAPQPQPVPVPQPTPAPEVVVPQPIIVTPDQVFLMPDETPFAEEDEQEHGIVAEPLRPSCPERPNAFSLGGQIVRVKSSGAMYLVLPKLGVACQVHSARIAASWGVTKFTSVADIEDYELSSPVPYRPGTIVQNRVTRERYFANTKGQLQKFASMSLYSKLGYGRNRVVIDEPNVLAKLPSAVTLSRSDIHPDGTLFILNAKKGEYAVLQERVLHPLTLKSVRAYGENPGRAVSLGKGEGYPMGERWDK